MCEVLGGSLGLAHDCTSALLLQGSVAVSQRCCCNASCSSSGKEGHHAMLTCSFAWVLCTSALGPLLAFWFVCVPHAYLRALQCRLLPHASNGCLPAALVVPSREHHQWRIPSRHHELKLKVSKQRGGSQMSRRLRGRKSPPVLRTPKLSRRRARNLET